MRKGPSSALVPHYQTLIRLPSVIKFGPQQKLKTNFLPNVTRTVSLLTYGKYIWTSLRSRVLTSGETTQQSTRSVVQYVFNELICTLNIFPDNWEQVQYIYIVFNNFSGINFGYVTII
jgi:hypothetical protein